MTPTQTVSGGVLGERELGGDPAVRAVFGGRGDGNASLEVGEQGDLGRRALLARLGVDPSRAAFMEQVHGGAIARVDRPSPRVPGVDALVTTAHDLALVVLTADCVPILLAEPGRGVAVVHAGRRGVEQNVVGAAVAALTSATGSGPERVHALVGPAIGGCCYELPRDTADAVAAAVPMAASTTSWGTPSLDLRAAAELQLRAAGVRGITRAGGCTRCDPDRWFSHRATARGAAPGRNASAIVRRSAA